MSDSRKLITLSIIAAFFSGIIYVNTSKAEGKTFSNEELVKRGKFLVEFGGCSDCHTPKIYTDHGPVPNAKLLLSGHPSTLALPKYDYSSKPQGWSMTNEHLTAWVGPWGASFAANITPDKSTGIGNWTEDIFVKAMRTGKHMGEGRPILPPMPWFNLMTLPEEDLKAIFAYLQSIPPVNNLVPPALTPDELAKQ